MIIHRRACNHLIRLIAILEIFVSLSLLKQAELTTPLAEPVLQETKLAGADGQENQANQTRNAKLARKGLQGRAYSYTAY
ncbi:hypothetical protein [Leptolyngbya sp. FACHB-261]|uniref:hypothetical protein n=1 Tax=Leptolyngbya sp. FACHB-261 TaxID=2692806 RepID=UPI001687645B|nr:hypothetical protein [Leptolyngbya sp. FACHB-261]MBD2100812.1 hypothetical protein [Leptolyngbya sp. FACHB-261]